MTDLTPSAWIDGWTSDGTDVGFPVASLPELSAAEADPGTGSFPNVLYALLREAYAKWALVALADRPVNMTLFRNVSTDPGTDVSEETFTCRFNTGATTRNVIAEDTGGSGS